MPAPAKAGDRDGAIPLLRQSRRRHPCVKVAFADSAYNSQRVVDATSIGIQIVTKIADQKGFVVLPRRWVVERTFAWLNRNRRLSKDFGAIHTIGYSVTLRRSCPAPHPTPGSLRMRFKTDSQIRLESKGRGGGGSLAVRRGSGGRCFGWIED